MLAAAAILAAAPAGAAQWERVAASAGSVWYIDGGSVRVDGHIRRAQLMLDDQGAGGSMKATTEFDCREGRSRHIEGSVYDGRMGAGEILFAGKFPEPWSAAPRGTVRDTLLKAICSLPPAQKNRGASMKVQHF